ncbi:hypothetical protein BS50DRAFT_229381 [Corynespora cassiicola Philippines]|uniref:Secreted protein n=1 Tax=Corynespora cassiicola Philippines TaxID=1448308 RepID=A0A2T2N2C4_CORCC|nr:hypothetical protein BS50DRAFT_229381 [Corynespora cassiicola Philippines]
MLMLILDVLPFPHTTQAKDAIISRDVFQSRLNAQSTSKCKPSFLVTLFRSDRLRKVRLDLHVRVSDFNCHVCGPLFAKSHLAARAPHVWCELFGLSASAVLRRCRLVVCTKRGG